MSRGGIRTVVSVAVLVLAEAGSALAHPGHGAGVGGGSSIAHYLSEPMHALPWLVGSLVAIGLVIYMRRRRATQ